MVSLSGKNRITETVSFTLVKESENKRCVPVDISFQVYNWIFNLHGLNIWNNLGKLFICKHGLLNSESK